MKEQWDEFPNGRWGDGRSPAFGDLSSTHSFFRSALGTTTERLTMWGGKLLSTEIHDDLILLIQFYALNGQMDQSMKKILLKCL